MNSSLQKLNLRSKFFELQKGKQKQLGNGLTDNNIGNEGFKALSEALKTNTALITIHLEGFEPKVLLMRNSCSPPFSLNRCQYFN